jgi:hypothetical protein
VDRIPHPEFAGFTTLHTALVEVKIYFGVPQLEKVSIPVAIHVTGSGVGSTKIYSAWDKLSPTLVEPQCGTRPKPGLAFMAEIRKDDVQAAIAVQIRHAGGVVVRAAAIDAIDQVVQVTHPGKQQKQQYDYHPSEMDNGLWILSHTTFFDHFAPPQAGSLSLEPILKIRKSLFYIQKT